MEIELSFTFRNKGCTCLAYIDASEEPCYVFVQLKDKWLIEEFGEEITIKTDLVQRLPKKDDLGEIVHLRQSVFEALKEHPQLGTVKRRKQLMHSLNTDAAKERMRKYGTPSK